MPILKVIIFKGQCISMSIMIERDITHIGDSSRVERLANIIKGLDNDGWTLT